MVVPAQTLSLGLSLLSANELLGRNAVPQFDRIGRTYLHGALHNAGHDPKNGLVVAKVHNDGTVYEGDFPRALGFWDSAYGSSSGYAFVGAERFAIMCLNAHRLTGSTEHLELAKDVWDVYQKRPPPTEPGIVPGKFAGLIALSLDLHDLTGEDKYLVYARKIADWAMKDLYVNGLFRAATGAKHHEAANGAGALALELLRLHLVVTGNEYELPLNYWDI